MKYFYKKVSILSDRGKGELNNVRDETSSFVARIPMRTMKETPDYYTITVF